ncbi:hypothetical protein [Hydrocoleum sp. CS-953]|uniref:hypothetical protein n=1 Tax=Microcoleaceae TaxID=1892252 RepID=UPI000B9B41A0|nr:hypothetical protein [Hydrocoleum sp. CS-953]OZH53672.1 hypothetical protein AFK68_16050 [Hydrocoleum sp. CS-953]
MNTSNFRTFLQATIVGATFSLLQYPATAVKFASTINLTNSYQIVFNWEAEKSSFGDMSVQNNELTDWNATISDSSGGQLQSFAPQSTLEFEFDCFSCGLGPNWSQIAGAGIIKELRIIEDDVSVFEFSYLDDQKVVNSELFPIDTDYISQLTKLNKVGSAEDVTSTNVQTPEPALTIGLITLSSLMLGGRRNTRKAKA